MKRCIPILAVAFVLVYFLTACKTSATLRHDDFIAAQVQKAVFTTKGNLETDIPAAAPQALAAVRSALDQRGYQITDEQLETAGTIITATPKILADDVEQGYRVSLTPQANTTHITIRLGKFGHDPASRALLKSTLLNLER